LYGVLELYSSHRPFSSAGAEKVMEICIKSDIAISSSKIHFDSTVEEN